MKLVITTDEGLDDNFDTVIMSPVEFNSLYAHPYIATSGFDEVQIDLTDKIEAAYLSYVSKVTLIRPIYHNFDLSMNAITALSYLYPDKKIALRHYAMTNDKEKLNALLQELADTYEWRKIG